VLCDPRQHARTDLLVVVKREHEIRKSRALQNTVRSGLPLDLPAETKESRKQLLGLMERQAFTPR